MQNLLIYYYVNVRHILKNIVFLNFVLFYGVISVLTSLTDRQLLFEFYPYLYCSLPMILSVWGGGGLE